MSETISRAFTGQAFRIQLRENEACRKEPNSKNDVHIQNAAIRRDQNKPVKISHVRKGKQEQIAPDFSPNSSTYSKCTVYP
jgi:hypothetical protein